MSKRPKEVEALRGFNRALLVFAPERSHPAYGAAREALRAAGDQLHQWEIHVFAVFGSGAVYEDGERREQADASAYRRDFGAHREEFTVVLLDMDGIERLRQHRRLDLDEVFDTLKILRPPQPGKKLREPAPHARR